MTGLIISLIGLAAVGYALWLATMQNRRLMRQIAALQDIVASRGKSFNAINDLCCETDPQKYIYTIHALLHERVVVKHKAGLSCVVKHFNDADEDFNQRCAEELLEILNSK